MIWVLLVVCGCAVSVIVLGVTEAIKRKKANLDIFNKKSNKSNEKIKKIKDEKNGSKLKSNNQKGNTDYNQYSMTIKEKVYYSTLAAIGIFLIGFVFYRSYILSIILMPIGLLYPRIKKRDLINKQKMELNLQFKEGLYALSSSLSAGRSIEEAFRESIKDLSILYPNQDTYIIVEFQYIVRKLDMNETIENALLDFANRSHLDDITSFVDVFIIAKRTGGNMVAIIHNTSNVIGDKLRIKQEIQTLVAQKKLEQKVLSIIPILMIIFISWSAPDYMEIVFKTNLGRLLMTVAVLLLSISYLISKKIIDIEV
ncbi:type II secretion system F family protein [Sporosalibacterium faouarense]|uniref:type II secretion system F family protein n=1 Tax=Sporosalibacterium faouarense TaxID=516123 RepID=UPI001FAFE767|nr:type II secretion system F family protein [Sporosalibacterium faouarense]